MHWRVTQTVIVFVLIMSISGRVLADEPIDFAKQVRPLLNRQCVGCHGALRREGGLRLDAVQFIRKGGDGGAGLVPNDPQASRIIQAVTGTNRLTRMPEGGDPLPADEISILTRWIAAGAVARDEPIPTDPRRNPSVLEEKHPPIASPPVLNQGGTMNWLPCGPQADSRVVFRSRKRRGRIFGRFSGPEKDAGEFLSGFPVPKTTRGNF